MPTVKLNLAVPIKRTARARQVESLFDVAPASGVRGCHLSTARRQAVIPRASRGLSARLPGRRHRDVVLQVVKRHPGAVTAVVARLAELSTSKALGLLKELAERGQVERKGSGTKSNSVSWLAD